MSRETPAAHAARIKVQFGARYAIASDEHGYTARDRKSGRTIRADSPGDLEALLIEHAAGRARSPGRGAMMPRS